MPRLRKLCLTFFSMRPINAATKAYLRGLKTVEHLHLTHSPGDFIVPLSSAHMAPMSRRRSITALQDMSMADVRDVLNGTTTPAEDLLFPELHTVSLNTLKASDVAWLCNLVAVRAPRIRTVQLSSSAMRHLEGSLRRRGDKIETSPLTVLGSRRHAEDVQLPKDVGRWLRERVRVEAEEEHREGLHQLSRDVVDGIGITQEFTL
ncbi:uncharacterized protein SCHCODRAFT_02496748 [Schizophyllum commune H4-8]|uniref:Expressed protein n=1 Tax=Schizophyllum commune (strain H4-8 / FGSC 9210) TaxID=578458 RepID=D8Q273_SCHCM|nr:uncharacterized protein SCHCODRAFT_02496748 [Schizophyllum commune H4-8]KAI5895754.1 hypothetical protein SCHCODRAFT_02496748 [Schizophyllum commune H4-8]